MNIKRIMIAAPKSGSGKTVVTCALLCALKNSGLRVIAYKCGPDYIDTMFHKEAIGIASKNLDTFFTGAEQTKRLFVHSAAEYDFAVMEGVMGIFDGLGGVQEQGSSYHLAKVTKTPIVLVVDAKGMGRSLIPLIAGFLAYDTEQMIRGVILNRISGGYFEIIKPLIEKELNIRVIGFLPEREELRMESRHLGLMMPGELDGMKQRLQTATTLFLKTVSTESIRELAECAQELKGPEIRVEIGQSQESRISCTKKTVQPVIAVARDEAFCFYYEDNILMLMENGAKIEYFSPLRDEKLPEECHALLFGGGYPELYAKDLSANKKMREEVKKAVEHGMPVVAECGGFLYLHTTLIDKNGISYPMAGVVKGSCFYTGKLVRFGYVELQEKRNHFLQEGQKIRGHEFHYYDSSNNGEDVVAIKPASGKRYDCMIENENCCIGFPHLYYPSNPVFAKSFVGKAKKYYYSRPGSRS